MTAVAPGPLVSVIIPVRDGEATIDACIASVLRLDWPRERLEVVVVDNDSSDGTAAILQRYAGQVRVLRETRRGVSAARNAGIRAAHGQWIAFTDADCIVEPAWLACLVAPLADPTVGLVGGGILSIEPCNRIERFGERIHDHRRAIEELDPPYAIGMNWASPRAVLDRVGLFDEVLLRCEDVDLARRIASAGYRMVYAGNACVRHRNERTFRGLFAEGAAHGSANVALRGRVGERLYGSPVRDSCRRLRRSSIRALMGPDHHTAVCEAVFEAGKLYGAAAAHLRRRAPRPIGSMGAAADALEGTGPTAAANARDRKLLLACYEPPGFGGAATAGYDLFRALRRDGHEAVYVNLLDERDGAFFDYTFGRALGNPEGLEGVHNVEVGGPYTPNAGLAAVVAAARPDLMIGIGYPAVLALRTSVPGRRLIFLTSGCRAAEELVLSRRVPDAAALLDRLDVSDATPPAGADQERDAIVGADYVVAHSEMTHRFIERLYPRQAGKLHPVPIGFGAWIHAAAACYAHVRRPFHERSIGALFVASSWDRPEKNYAGLRRIAELLPHGTIHVVGDVPAPIAGVVHHGFIADRAPLFERMGDARAVVCPSLIDAAPGILHEGAALGCNLVASRNCGNHTLCHPQLLAEPRTPESWAACIERALVREYVPGFDGAASAGYAELVEILAAV